MVPSEIRIISEIAFLVEVLARQSFGLLGDTLPRLLKKHKRNRGHGIRWLVLY